MITEVYIASKYEGDIVEQYLIHDDGTCILQWMFDGVAEDDSVLRKILMVQLTEPEAKKVIERNTAKIGMIEPIRNNLTYPEARIMFIRRAAPYTFSQTTITIPHEGTEEDFLDYIDGIANNIEFSEQMKRTYHD